MASLPERVDALELLTQELQAKDAELEQLIVSLDKLMNDLAQGLAGLEQMKARIKRHRDHRLKYPVNNKRESFIR